jgi:hypothetical protein
MPPRSLRFGGLSSVYVGDRSERSLLEAPRPVKSPLDGTRDSVNKLFELSVAAIENGGTFVRKAQHFRRFHNHKIIGREKASASPRP